jgi:UDP-glucose-4-epimerase GalE
MIPILVTGGAGYIGAHTCKALLGAGFYPITYDNLSTGHAYAVQWGPLVQGDLRDKETLSQVFTKYRPLAVLHFAASALVVESMQDPGKYYDNNVYGSLCLLETMRQHKIPHLVFSSTCATYGNPESLHIDETHPQRPINPYGRSKWMVEQIIEDFTKTYDLSAVNLRYFNAAGADLQREIGENHTPETHILPLIIQTALGLRNELTIYGTDFPTPDGSAVRDYIHVTDLAKAHVLSLQWLLKHKKNVSLNLGNGKGFSILELVTAVEAFSQKAVPLKFSAKREGEPAYLVADAAKAKKILNWTPLLPLSAIISSAWNWHTEGMFEELSTRKGAGQVPCRTL